MKIWSKGFTLVELMVVVVIVLIVFGGLIGSCGGCQQMFFRKNCEGRVTGISNLSGQVSTIVTGRNNVFPGAAFSFAVEMSVGNEIVNFSAEDRQFATIEKGDSISVAIFKYPPWVLDKAGTYHGGRLLRKYKIN
jgi:prepilin-type N-terminal cleavage/methylation domain-containing protein